MYVLNGTLFDSIIMGDASQGW